MKMSKELCSDWEKLASEEHIGLSQYMNVFAIRVMLAVGFGQYFQDDKKILEFKKCYDIVRENDNIHCF